MVFNSLVACFKKHIVSLAFSLGRRWQEQEAKWVWRLGFSQHRVVQPLDAAGEQWRKKTIRFVDLYAITSLKWGLFQTSSTHESMNPKTTKFLSTCFGLWWLWIMETTVIHTLFASPTGEMAEPRQRSDVPEMSRKDLRKSERQISGPTKTFDGCFFMWKLCEIIVKFWKFKFWKEWLHFLHRLHK